MNLIPLRVYSAGRHLPFCCPFLDLAVLDVMRYVPRQYRRDKRWHKSVLRRHLPQLFEMPRSRRDQTEFDLGPMVHNAQAELREYLSGLTVGIPGVMTPSDLGNLLDLAVGSQASGLQAAKQWARGAIKTALVHGPIPAYWQWELRNLAFNKFNDRTGTAKLFVRALQLAMAFERIQASWFSCRACRPPAIQARNAMGNRTEPPTAKDLQYRLFFVLQDLDLDLHNAGNLFYWIQAKWKQMSMHLLCLILFSINTSRFDV
jgi:hypothetical protein